MVVESLMEGKVMSYGAELMSDPLMIQVECGPVII